MFVDRNRIRIEIKQPTTPRNDCRKVTQITQGGATQDVLGCVREFDDSWPARQTKGPTVRTPFHLFDSGNGGRCEMSKEIVRTKGLAKREAEHDGRTSAPCFQWTARLQSQCGW